VQRQSELTKVEGLFRRASESFRLGNLGEAERLYKKFCARSRSTQVPSTYLAFCLRG
jgi:hypothetical protein